MMTSLDIMTSWMENNRIFSEESDIESNSIVFGMSHINWVLYDENYRRQAGIQFMHSHLAFNSFTLS